MPEHVIKLASSLHDGSWFDIESDAGQSTPIRTSRGGRQGCRLGAVVFNYIYAKALRETRQMLRDAGIILELPHRVGDAFWVSPKDAEQQRREKHEPAAEIEANEVVETTYVDDELMMLSTSSPTAMEKAIMVMMDALDTSMRSHGFLVNWKRGKTEIMIKLRGSKAAVVEQRLINKRGDDYVIALPSGFQILQVVGHYKHLGGIICDDGDMRKEIRARCSAALAAYVPLACRVFGSKSIAVPLRVSFCGSLIMSRLLYNAATWPELSGPNLKMLNKLYMTVLRKIAGKPRCGGSEAMSDESVRRFLNVPSISCLLVRARLRALPQVLRNGPPCLQSLLQVCGGRTNRQGAWARAVMQDLVKLREAVIDRLGALGDPCSNSREWMQMIADYPREWKQIVARYTSTSDLFQKVGHCQAHLSESDNLQKRRRIATDGVHPQPVLQTCIVCEPTRPTPRSESPSESVFQSYFPKVYFPEVFAPKVMPLRRRCSSTRGLVTVYETPLYKLSARVSSALFATKPLQIGGESLPI